MNQGEARILGFEDKVVEFGLLSNILFYVCECFTGNFANISHA